MITYLGSLTIGDAIPGLDTAIISGIGGINAALPDILERIAALQAFAPQPVSFAAQLQLANSILDGINLSMSLGISPPSIAAQIAAVLALINELLNSLTNINGFLDVLVNLQGLLSAVGIHAYAYSGQTQDLPGDLASEIASGTPGGNPTDAANALIWITTVPGTWAALAQVAKVTP